MKCAYNTAKECDGLCNNCAKNIKPDSMSWDKIIHATNHLRVGNDYEGAILALQERNEIYDEV